MHFKYSSLQNTKSKQHEFYIKKPDSLKLQTLINLLWATEMRGLLILTGWVSDFIKLFTNTYLYLRPCTVSGKRGHIDLYRFKIAVFAGGFLLHFFQWFTTKIPNARFQCLLVEKTTKYSMGSWGKFDQVKLQRCYYVHRCGALVLFLRVYQFMARYVLWSRLKKLRSWNMEKWLIRWFASPPTFNMARDIKTIQLPLCIVHLSLPLAPFTVIRDTLQICSYNKLKFWLSYGECWSQQLWDLC